MNSKSIYLQQIEIWRLDIEVTRKYLMHQCCEEQKRIGIHLLQILIDALVTTMFLSIVLQHRTCYRVEILGLWKGYYHLMIEFCVSAVECVPGLRVGPLGFSNHFR